MAAKVVNFPPSISSSYSRRLVHVQHIPHRATCSGSHTPVRQVKAFLHGLESMGLLAEAIDSPPEWTLDQIAGLVFGGLLVLLYTSSRVIDNYVANSQRRQLGLCEKCGGLYDEGTCPEKDCPKKQ